MTPRPRDFREAAPGPGWAALPLPALILDADGRVAAMNDAAEIWLNLSRNSTLGRALDGDEMSMRLRLQPGLGPLLARVRASEEALYQTSVQFEIGDRTGNHQARRAAVHAGPADGAGGSVSLLRSGERAWMYSRPVVKLTVSESWLM